MPSLKFLFLCFAFLTRILMDPVYGKDSFLYNQKGQLRLDTTLTISAQQYDTWRQAELDIVYVLSHIQIPDLFMEGIPVPEGTKSVVIATFVCDTADITDVHALNDTSWYARAVERGLKSFGKSIAGKLKGYSARTSEGVYTGRYYVAISFMLIDFYEQLNLQKAVPVIKTTIPLLDSRAH
jgi:hypothetical protein